MTPNELQERQRVLDVFRDYAAPEHHEGYSGIITVREMRLVLAMLDEARFVAEEYTHIDDPHYTNSYTEQLAYDLVAEIAPSSSPKILPIQQEIVEYFASDDVLEHVEANDYTLKPAYSSAWVAVDSLAVYICRMNGGLLVEVHPNHAEAARPYAKSFVEFEPEEGAE